MNNDSRHNAMTKRIDKAFSHHPKQWQNQNGVSLVELMIVLTLSVVLIAGIIRFYIGNKTVQVLQSDVSQVQSDARFSMELLSRDFRMADSGGCRKLSYWSGLQGGSSRVKNHVVNGPAILNNLKPISGWEANNTGPSDQLNNANFHSAQITGRTAADWTAGGGPINIATNLAIPNSDIVTIMYSGAANTRVTGGSINSLQLVDASNVNTGDFLLVSDCGGLDIVVACSVNKVNDTVSLTDTSQGAACGLGNADLRNDQVPLVSNVSNFVVTASKLVSNTYFVGKPAGGANNSRDLAPALFKITNGSPAQQIVEGVESMQILYDGKPISSYTSTAMANSIRTIRISLLMSTENKISVTRAQRTFDLNGFQVTPVKDQHIRRVYNTSIALRAQL